MGTTEFTPQDIANIILQLSVAITAIGTLLTALATSFQKRKQSIALDEQLEMEKKLQEVEITERLKSVAADLVDSLREELDTWKERVVCLEAKLKEQQSENKRLRIALIDIIDVVNAVLNKLTAGSYTEFKDELILVDTKLAKLQDEFDL